MNVSEILSVSVVHSCFQDATLRSPERYNEGFAVLPHRWIVERMLSWLLQNRRLSKDYERKVQSSETFIEVAMIHLILKRLAREV